MNQPTNTQFEELKKRVEKLEQQQTEPIKVTRIEIEQPRDLLQDISRKQDEQDRLLVAHSRGISTLQTEMQGARADIMSIKATQSDHGELLMEHGKALAEIKATMATKEDIASIKATQDKILQLLQRSGE